MQIFNFSKEVVGTPLEHAWGDIYEPFHGWNTLSTASDLVRYILLHKHGGLWFAAPMRWSRA